VRIVQWLMPLRDGLGIGDVGRVRLISPSIAPSRMLRMVSRAWIGDRIGLLTLALLMLVTMAAWGGVIVQAISSTRDGGSSMGAGMSAGMEPLVTPAGLVAFVAAWVVMMAAMMLPSAAPMILLYRAMLRSHAARSNPLASIWIFVGGYLFVWAAFGVVVYLAGQLVGAALRGDARLAEWAPYGVALVLLAAGVYQFTSLKRACLRACQSPLGFLMAHWRPGPWGTCRMGLEHGVYCAGCCWGLMAVLVAAGAMGLAWVLLIAVVVAAEKLLPHGQWAARITGVVLLVLGALVAAQPQIALALRGQGM
jgi:predicted metal-binding membrane protein